MGFKFAIGQAVEYRPVRGRLRLCKIIKQMPQEDGQFDFKYRVKNDQETFERNVFECDLAPSDKPANLYSFVARLHGRK